MIFDVVGPDQVTAIHNLHKILRKLRVIGIIRISCTSVRVTEIDRPIRYRLKFISYDETMKGQLTVEEKLEYLISMKSFFDNSTRQSE